MGNKYMLYAAHLCQRQITYTGASIDQDIVINQK
jgi:hypothetical protein